MSYLKPGHCAFQHSSSNDTMVAACPYFFRHSLLENLLLQLPKRKNDLNTFMCENLNREVSVVNVRMAPAQISTQLAVSARNVVHVI